MFSLLDRAYLLARGRAVYGGDPASAAAFFKSCGVPCPAGDAIAEHMLHAASDPVTLGALLAGVQGNGAAGGGSPRVLPAGHGTVGAGKDGAAEKGPADAQELALVELEAGPGTTRSGTEGSQGVDAAGRGTVSDPGPGRSRSLELAVLFWRAGLDIARNPSLLLLHWAMALGMGIFTGCIFLNVGLDISGAQNRAGERSKMRRGGGEGGPVFAIVHCRVVAAAPAASLNAAGRSSHEPFPASPAQVACSSSSPSLPSRA